MGSPLFWILVLMNALTFVFVFLDKCFAKWRLRRIPEIGFYLLTFFGGSIGMLVGMYTFRHKTKKLSFQIVIGVLILVQVALLINSSLDLFP